MTTRQAESTIPTGTWQSDPVHSTVGFAVRHAVGTFRGSFGVFDATLSDGSGEPQLTGHVPVESVEVKDENLEAHLLSPEFFDKDQAPEIRFESTKVAQDGDELEVDGELTVKGASKAVVASGKLSGPISGPDGNDRIGIDLETTVDRHDYGLDWNMDMPDGSKMLGDEVTLTVHLELVKEEA
jgi:polyisoprenoid-binding protein YceI